MGRIKGAITPDKMKVLTSDEAWLRSVIVN